MRNQSKWPQECGGCGSEAGALTDALRESAYSSSGPLVEGHSHGIQTQTFGKTKQKTGRKYFPEPRARCINPTAAYGSLATAQSSRDTAVDSCRGLSILAHNM